jgi:hypothetical protein
MGLVAGSLTEGIQKAAKNGVVAVLIIDQPEPKLQVNVEVPFLTRAQQRLLGYAASMGCKFWRIELSQHGIVGAFPTATALKAYLPMDAPIITKQKLNAFEGTSLAADLATAHVTHVVVLGHEMNCCVKQTAIGGSYRRNDPFIAGATGNGLEVLTTREVLSGNGDPSWIDAPKVTFYTTLG